MSYTNIGRPLTAFLRLLRVATSLTIVLLVLLVAGLAPAAVAQVAATPAAQPTDETLKLEKFVVTGSLIKRLADEGSLPVQVLSRQDMEQQGIASAEQMIMAININGNGLDNLASNSDVVSGAQRGNNGASSANLRGQGNGATLVLLNGRRIASHGLNGGVVDLNSIPFAALERVEILKDGASAIYGTDAIGGVINFILRTNYTGLSTGVRAFLSGLTMILAAASTPARYTSVTCSRSEPSTARRVAARP